MYEGNTVVGDIQPYSGYMVFEYNSKQHKVSQYEVLCHPQESGRQAITLIPASEIQTQGKRIVISETHLQF
jgi:hypothetical protein